MTACLSLFLSISYLAIVSSFAIAGGSCFLFLGSQLLVRKRLLLKTRNSKISTAAPGLAEVHGIATGPDSISSPITGKPCFLYRTTAWEERAGQKKEEWRKVAEETLHVPFFIDDCTGQLLIEPLGADLDLHHDFCEEYEASFFCSNFSPNRDEVPRRVAAFLSRHAVIPGRRVRIEERLIKPEDSLFVAGTIAQNPGIEVRSAAALRNHPVLNSVATRFTAPPPAPQVIRLAFGAAASSSQHMGQQAKIAAALTRAGVAKPDVWSPVAVPSAAVEESVSPTATSADADSCKKTSHPRETTAVEKQTTAAGFSLTPPLLLRKGADNMLAISFRSQKESLGALARKSAALVWGGAAITALGLYALIVQIRLR